MQKISNTKDGKTTQKQKLIVLATFIVFVLAYDLTFGGNIRYYANWVRCGNSPVVLHPGNAVLGEVQNYTIPPSVSIYRLQPDYACSARAAELTGYSADPKGCSLPLVTSEERKNIPGVCGWEQFNDTH